MERQVGKGDSPGKGLRLEWQVLCQPIADRQSDDWHVLERSPLLRLANGEVRSRCAGGPWPSASRCVSIAPAPAARPLRTKSHVLDVSNQLEIRPLRMRSRQRVTDGGVLR